MEKIKRGQEILKDKDSWKLVIGIFIVWSPGIIANILRDSTSLSEPVLLIIAFLPWVLGAYLAFRFPLSHQKKYRTDDL